MSPEQKRGLITTSAAGPASARCGYEGEGGGVAIDALLGLRRHRQLQGLSPGLSAIALACMVSGWRCWESCWLYRPQVHVGGRVACTTCGRTGAGLGAGCAPAACCGSKRAAAPPLLMLQVLALSNAWFPAPASVSGPHCARATSTRGRPSPLACACSAEAPTAGHTLSAPHGDSTRSWGGDGAAPGAGVSTMYANGEPALIACPMCPSSLRPAPPRGVRALRPLLVTSCGCGGKW